MEYFMGETFDKEKTSHTRNWMQQRKQQRNRKQPYSMNLAQW